MVLKNSNVKLIIFDLDGTLIDSKYDLTDSVNFVRVKYGFSPLSVDKIVSYLGSGITALLRAALPELNDDLFKQALAEFLEYYELHLVDKTKYFDGIKDVLVDLKEYKKVLLSNKIEKFSKSILNSLNLSQYFDAIFGGDSFKEKKPNPLPVNEIIKMFSMQKENVIMVGDGANDVNVGKNAGIKTLGVLYGYSSQEQMKKLAPDYFAKEPKEIITIIRS